MIFQVFRLKIFKGVAAMWQIRTFFRIDLVRIDLEKNSFLGKKNDLQLSLNIKNVLTFKSKVAYYTRNFI
jgi:hypothetical protein